MAWPQEPVPQPDRLSPNERDSCPTSWPVRTRAAPPRPSWHPDQPVRVAHVHHEPVGSKAIRGGRSPSTSSPSSAPSPRRGWVSSNDWSTPPGGAEGYGGTRACPQHQREHGAVDDGGRADGVPRPQADDRRDQRDAPPRPARSTPSTTGPTPRALLLLHDPRAVQGGPGCPLPQPLRTQHAGRRRSPREPFFRLRDPSTPDGWGNWQGLDQVQSPTGELLTAQGKRDWVEEMTSQRARVREVRSAIWEDPTPHQGPEGIGRPS